MAKKVLMVIASDRFQDFEYEKPRAALDEAGCVVEVASSQAGECTGTFGQVVVADESRLLTVLR